MGAGREFLAPSHTDKHQEMGKSHGTTGGYSSEADDAVNPYGSEVYSILEADCDGCLADQPRVLRILSALLERVVARNDSLTPSSYASAFPPSKLTVFHGLRAPSINVDKYLERIYKYGNCSPACFVIAYIYIDRIVHLHPDLPITSLNVHRILVTSVMLAAKFQDDAYFNNAYYAKVGGVTTGEMNRLEIEFLFRLGFRLHVTPTMFGNYCTHLEQELLLLDVPVPASLVVFEAATDKCKSTAAAQQQQSRPLIDTESCSMDSNMDSSYEVQTPPRDTEPYCRPSRFETASPMAE